MGVIGQVHFLKKCCVYLYGLFCLHGNRALHDYQISFIITFN